MQARADFDVSHIPAWMWQSADEVAAAGLAGVAANRPVVVAGWHNRVSVALMNALPGALRRRAMARMSR